VKVLGGSVRNEEFRSKKARYVDAVYSFNEIIRERQAQVGRQHRWVGS